MTTIIPTPEEFFNQVIQLDDKLAVHQACNELLDKLSKNFALSTIRHKKLTQYRKPFYGYISVNPELNESVTTKEGKKTQHIAAGLLELSPEQEKEIIEIQKQKDAARAGIDENGDFREVDKPPTNIEQVVKESLECLHSNDVTTIACGILNLTGLRANEQNQPKVSQQNTIIEREMIVIGEYLIAFKGLSKKRNLDDVNSYFVRPTLVPAKIIVDAHKKFLASPKVQSIPAKYESYRKSGFRKAIERKYQELFGETLSTIEAYDNAGRLVSANGTPHKARAFYACALRSILKVKGIRDTAINQYIQLSLVHDNTSETIKYLGRYDDAEFCNPIDINIPLNTKELGKMSTAVIDAVIEVEQTKQSTEQPTEQVTEQVTEQPTEQVTEQPTENIKTKFDIDKFIAELNELSDGKFAVKFQELINKDGFTLTDAVLGVIKSAHFSKSKVVQTIEPVKTTVSDEIKNIVTAILEYNSNQPEKIKCVVPSYTLINKISDKFLNKSMAKKTVDVVLSELNDDITSRLAAREITGLELANWNGKYHRKDLGDIIDEIVTILKNS